MKHLRLSLLLVGLILVSTLQVTTAIHESAGHSHLNPGHERVHNSIARRAHEAIAAERMASGKGLFENIEYTQEALDDAEPSFTVSFWKYVTAPFRFFLGKHDTSSPDVSADKESDQQKEQWTEDSCEMPASEHEIEEEIFDGTETAAKRSYQAFEASKHASNAAQHLRNAKDQDHKVEQKRGIFGSIKDTFSYTMSIPGWVWRKIVNPFSSTENPKGSRVRSGAQEAYEKLQQGAKRAGERASQQASSTYNKAKDNAESINNKLKDNAKSAYDKVKEGVNYVNDAAWKKAEEAKENVKDQAHDVGDSFKQKAKQGAEKVSDAAETTKETIETGYEHAKEGVKAAAHRAGQVAEDVRDKTKEAAENVYHKAADAGNAAKENVETFGHKLAETTQAGFEKVKEAVHIAKDKVSQAGAKTGELLEEGKEKAKDAYEGTKHVIEEASETAEEVYEGAKDKAAAVAETGKSVFQATKDKAGQVIEGTKETVELGAEKLMEGAGTIYHGVEGVLKGTKEAAGNMIKGMTSSKDSDKTTSDSAKDKNKKGDKGPVASKETLSLNGAYGVDELEKMAEDARMQADTAFDEAKQKATEVLDSIRHFLELKAKEQAFAMIAENATSPQEKGMLSKFVHSSVLPWLWSLISITVLFALLILSAYGSHHLALSLTSPIFPARSEYLTRRPSTMSTDQL